MTGAFDEDRRTPAERALTIDDVHGPAIEVDLAEWKAPSPLTFDADVRIYADAGEGMRWYTAVELRDLVDAIRRRGEEPSIVVERVARTLRYDPPAPLPWHARAAAFVQALVSYSPLWFDLWLTRAEHLVAVVAARLHTDPPEQRSAVACPTCGSLMPWKVFGRCAQDGVPSDRWHTQKLEEAGRSCEECELGVLREGDEWAPCPHCYPPDWAR